MPLFFFFIRYMVMKAVPAQQTMISDVTPITIAIIEEGFAVKA